MKTRMRFTFRVDTWTPDGESIVEHVGAHKMEKDYLILNRASASHPSGEWNEDDYDVLADGPSSATFSR